MFQSNTRSLLFFIAKIRRNQASTPFYSDIQTLDVSIQNSILKLKKFYFSIIASRNTMLTIPTRYVKLAVHK